ncbi:outer membrane lipoprotein carrier protein LolA [Desulforhopalus vacuolatus]|uniref:LolA family protein n=1 Tax=Desulforhopalus vacuolatus TaxID=40414 RepID=UPI0019643862|nr:outer-membrane lipoprotein carrier protein LolA [Desulforhopalus vacuolatus]MBM9519741.1 outer membrane lipoprotein carrier protein LolA [Desulforhopalus vacuolatus]
MKFFIALTTLLISILFFVAPGAAAVTQDHELDVFLQQLQAASEKTSSYTTQFSQEKHLAMLARPVLFSGQLSLVRPDKLRWQFLNPIPSTLIFNGDKGIRCDAEGESASFTLASDPVMKIVSEQLWSWLGGDYQKLAAQYQLDKEDKATLVVSFKSEQPIADFLSRVRIRFDEENLQPIMIEIDEKGGDFTRIIFTESRLNETLADTLFNKCELDD